jgi:hypothetical protein
LSEIGLHYDFIDESVNGQAQFVAPDHDIRSRIRTPKAETEALAATRIWRDHRFPTMEAPMSLGPGDNEPSQFHGGESSGTSPLAPVSRVTFERKELDRIFSLYGRKVAAGEWRDYAIDFLRDRAVFSVFRRASEVPLYRIEKNPKLARRQGAYSVISATGLIVRRGHELDRVLRAIDKSVSLVAV